MPTSSVISVVLAVVFLVAQQVRDDGEPRNAAWELLTVAQEANRKNIEAIRTLTFKLESVSEMVKEEGPPTDPSPVSRDSPPTSGGAVQSNQRPELYWQVGGEYRHQYLMTDGITVDELVRHGRKLGSTRVDGQPPHSLDRNWVRTRYGNPMLNLLFIHDGPDFLDTVTLDDLIAIPSSNRVAIVQDGEVYLSQSFEDVHYEFWFTPKHNYLIRKRIISRIRPEVYSTECEVLKYQACEGGVLFPTIVRTKSSRNGHPDGRGQVTVRDLLVNKPLSHDAMQLPDIQGLVCRDWTNMTKYRVDAFGYRVGLASECDGPTPAKVFLEPADPSKTLEPPPLAPWWVWGIVASLGVVVLAAGMEIQRLRKLVRNDGTVRPRGG